MSSGEGALVPGRKRRGAVGNSGPSHALPVLHVDLGVLWSKRHTGGALHIVTPDGDGWAALCSGRKAGRSYLGQPRQAGCDACRKALKDSATRAPEPSVDTYAVGDWRGSAVCATEPLTTARPNEGGGRCRP